MDHPLLTRFEYLEAEQRAAELALTDAEKRLSELAVFRERLQTVERFFSILADDKRAQLETQIEGLVDSGLKYVFGPEYAFKVRSELTGKQIKTKFFVVQHGLELGILDACGGGIADVASFLLRVTMLLLKQPSQARVLILDEPMKFVSEGHMDRLVEMIKDLSVSLDMQIIMTTHRQAFVDAATTVVRVSKTGMSSKAEVEHVLPSNELP